MKCYLFAVMPLTLHQGSRTCCVKLIIGEMQHYKDLVVLHVVTHNIWLKNVHLDYQEVQREGCLIQIQPAKSQRDDGVGQILVQVKNGKRFGRQKIKM